MSQKMRPKVLYKYRAFNALTVQMILNDELWLASPLTFNDPLDTKPQVKADLNASELEAIYKLFLRNRLISRNRTSFGEMDKGRLSPRHHLGRMADIEVKETIDSIIYDAEDPEYEGNGLEHLLVCGIQDEVLRRMDRGVCSLAERPNCPLMWSHYGDQHYGICLGYAVEDLGDAILKPVRYGGERILRTSLLKKMADGHPDAIEEVQDIIFCRKASEWQYEAEWRLLGKQGALPSPFKLATITFGLRCPDTVKFAIKKMFDLGWYGVGLYDVINRGDGFELSICESEMGAIEARYPYSNVAVKESFGGVDI